MSEVCEEGLKHFRTTAMMEMDTRTKKERSVPAELYHVSPHKIQIGGRVRPRWSMHSLEFAVWCLPGIESAKRLAKVVYRTWTEGCRFGFMGYTARSSYPDPYDPGFIRGLWIYRVKPTGPMVRTEGDGWKSAFALKVTGIAAKHGDPESNSMPPAPAHTFRQYAALKTLQPAHVPAREPRSCGSGFDAREVKRWGYRILAPEADDFARSPDCQLMRFRAQEIAEEMLRLYRDFRKPARSFKRFVISDSIRILSADKVEEFINRVIPEEAAPLDITDRGMRRRAAADFQCIFRACIRNGAIDGKALVESLAAWLHRRMQEEAEKAFQEYRKAHRKLMRDPRYERAGEKADERRRARE